MEGLARAGIGTLDIVDNDDVDITNINRQIIADHESVGRDKVDVCEERIRRICPETAVNKYKMFYLPEKEDQFQFSDYDYVVDAIDTVKAKIDIIVRAQEAGVPVISSMGCGNRMDPTRLVVTDIYKTHMDPLAKVMRKELRQRGVESLKVVYSEEPAIRPWKPEEIGYEPEEPAEGSSRRSTPGSTPWVPAAGGLIIAAEVVKDLTGFDPGDRVRGGRK